MNLGHQDFPHKLLSETNKSSARQVEFDFSEIPMGLVQATPDWSVTLLNKDHMSFIPGNNHLIIFKCLNRIGAVLLPNIPTNGDVPLTSHTANQLMSWYLMRLYFKSHCGNMRWPKHIKHGEI